MYRAHVTIKGIAPLSQSRMHNTPKLDGESHEDYDARTWREKANYDESGIVFVPAMALKQCVDAAAKRLAIPDPDNRRANFTKYFVSDVMCEAHMSIGLHKEEMICNTILANTDGVRGSGKRVQRRLPQTTTWGGTATFQVLEEKIKPDIFEQVLSAAGRSIGVGQFRPQNGGVNGRFEIVKVKYDKLK